MIAKCFSSIVYSELTKVSKYPRDEQQGGQADGAECRKNVGHHKDAVDCDGQGKVLGSILNKGLFQDAGASL